LTLREYRHPGPAEGVWGGFPSWPIRRAWTAARAEALTKEEQASPLAKRIYDLRHACLSLWLNAGVPPTQVAAWAGHSVEVLLRIYAKCIDGQDAIAKRRIAEALREHDASPSAERDASPEPDTGPPK
jgi:integrase